jgi:hypothetical protein
LLAITDLPALFLPVTTQWIPGALGGAVRELSSYCGDALASLNPPTAAAAPSTPTLSMKFRRVPLTILSPSLIPLGLHSEMVTGIVRQKCFADFLEFMSGDTSP